MHAVGDVADGNGELRFARIETRPHRRDTSPCSADTALARRDSFSPSTVMQNSSCWFSGCSRPSAMSCSAERPNSSRTGPRCSSIRSAVNRS